MARDLMDENYYISGGGMIPIKWTAPEVSLCLEKPLHMCTCSFVNVISILSLKILFWYCRSMLIIVGSAYG